MLILTFDVILNIGEGKESPMKKTKLLTLALVTLALAMILAVSMSVGASAAMADFNAVEEPLPDGNLLRRSDFDTDEWDEGVTANVKSLKHIETSTGGYLQYDKITANYSGIKVSNPNRAILPGKYKFTGYFRMMYEDEVTYLRVAFYDSDQMREVKNMKIAEAKVYPTSDEWMKVEVYLDLPTTFFGYVYVNGGPMAEYVQPYCIDNFSLVAVDSIPEGYEIPVFGTPVTTQQAVESQVDSLFYYPKYDKAHDDSRYDVNGLIVNLDADGIFGSDLGTKAQIEAYARGYEDSHVTDFMICLNNTNATYPSKVWTSISDKYKQKTENGIPVDYSSNSTAKNAYNHFIAKKLDYIDILCDTFPEVGINPWISFRMNDLHGHTDKTSVLLSDFYHKNPQLRRVFHKGYAAGNSYYYYGMDYSEKRVRDNMLALINEALGRYDCYGIELDFQREIYLWSHGNEYNGIEILNEFMREVERVVAVYEEKYKHEIKMCVRVASDIETNYEFGLDVLTWASEGIIDMVIPTGRYETTDTTIPVSLWTSLMHPYGVDVAPCIEININTYGSKTTTKGHSLAVNNGMAAAFLSQGADKVALYNNYLTIPTAIQAKHKVTTTDEMVDATWRHWVLATTLGSYDKLMTLDRRVILTYNDTYQIWDKPNAQLPQSCAAGESVVLRIPVGDVVPGSKVTLKIGVSAQNISKRPTVYVNSQTASWESLEMCDEGYSNYQLLTYNVPASALNSPYLTVEIVPQRTLDIDYAEVTVDVAE